MILLRTQTFLRTLAISDSVIFVDITDLSFVCSIF